MTIKFQSSFQHPVGEKASEALWKLSLPEMERFAGLRRLHIVMRCMQLPLLIFMQSVNIGLDESIPYLIGFRRN